MKILRSIWSWLFCSNTSTSGSGYEGGELSDTPPDPFPHPLGGGNNMPPVPVVPEPSPEPNPPTVEGNKFALIVGINRYQMAGADLNGCVNDARNMRSLLIDVFGFKSENIRVLTDERATKDNIIDRLWWLVTDRNPGDELFFHFSGHGSQIRDRSGDELEDHLDEILIVHDHEWDDPLLDDTLGDIFGEIPDGVQLTFVCDSCHSGSANRDIVQNKKIRYIAPPFDIASRSEGRDDLPVSKIGVPGSNEKSTGDVHVMEGIRHMLISGCRDNQTSADATFSGVWNGALSYNLVKVLRGNPQLTWRQVHENVIQNLMADGFSQVPQLTGPSEMIDRRPFD